MGKNKNFFRQQYKPKPVIALTSKELEKIKEDVRRETVDEMGKYDSEVMLTCFAYVLRSQYKWGHKRIFRVLAGVDDLFGRVLRDELSDADMRQQLENEVGIRIRCDRGDNDGIET